MPKLNLQKLKNFKITIFEKFINNLMNKSQRKLAHFKNTFLKLRKVDRLLYLFSAFLLITALTLSGVLIMEKNGDFKAVLSAKGENNDSNNQKYQNPKVLSEQTKIPLRGDNNQAFQSFKKFVNIKPISTQKISAKSFLVYDFLTGQILAQEKATTSLPIASITKLMTGLVAYENLDFSSKLVISNQDQLDIQPSLGLIPGDEIKVNDLFDSMIVGSANDAAKTLARHTELKTNKNFVDLMNQKALSLNMTSTHFSNPLGFDTGENYSSALDLQKLVAATQSLGVFTNLRRRLNWDFTSFKGNVYSIIATNKLLKDHSEMEAIKTGHTDFSLGSIIAKVNWQSHKLVFILIGSESREEDLEILEKEILSSFELEK